MITAIHIVGQIIVGGYFIYNGIKHLRNYKDYSAYAAHNKVPAPTAAVIGTGILIIIGGLLILFNIYMGIGILLVVIFLVGVTPQMHAFWKSENPAERASQKISFLKNLAILGALLLAVTGWK